MTTLSPLSTVLPEPAREPPPIAAVAPRRIQNRGDRLFFAGVTVLVWLVPLLVMTFLFVLLTGAWPAVKTFGWRFLIHKSWGANAEGGGAYRAPPLVYGA